MEAVATRASEADVRKFLQAYFDSMTSLDTEAIAAHYSPDVIAYDAIGNLEFVGRDAYKAHWKACLDMCKAMTFEPRDLKVHIDGDLAVAHALVRCGGTGLDDTEHLGWMRTTMAARRKDGAWQIVHEHHSAPFDPTSMTVVDLTPDS
jgi:uncharacterized protein (TIGR02246 family)